MKAATSWKDTAMGKLLGAPAATAQLSGWTARAGRDAIAKTYAFADFNVQDDLGHLARLNN